MIYVVLSTVFMTVAALTALWAFQAHRARSAVGTFTRSAVIAAALALLVLTAVFDNVMIAVGLFTYADEQISGIRLGLAPIEDFSYPLAAVILLPALWILVDTFGTSRSQR